MKNHWKIVNSICWIILALALVISCSLASAAERQGEEAENSITAEANPVQADPKNKPFDSFTWAIVGIALGSFGAIAHIKFNMQKGKDIGNNIEKVSLQTDKTSAADWEIVSRRESADPMEGNVHKVAADYEEKVKNLEARKKAQMAETSKVAVEIMRIWG